MLHSLIDLFLHLDTHLAGVIAQYGALTYAFLFLIIFAETGFVVTPFLPGDSLIFAAGTFAAKGSFHPALLFLLLSIAAIAGNTVNYGIGAYIGPRVFSEQHRWLRKDYLLKAHAFYQKYGAKTIIITRFMPIIRTFAPFVAGIGSMSWQTFSFYNIVGGLAWVGLFVFAGFYFGTIPAVEHNFTLVIFAIIFLSLLPPVIEWWRQRRRG